MNSSYQHFGPNANGKVWNWINSQTLTSLIPSIADDSIFFPSPSEDKQLRLTKRDCSDDTFCNMAGLSYRQLEVMKVRSKTPKRFRKINLSSEHGGNRGSGQPRY